MDQPFKDLLEASSLGTPAARRIRSSTPPEVVDDVRRRMENRREPSLSDAAASAPDGGQPDLADEVFLQRTRPRSRARLRSRLVSMPWHRRVDRGHPVGALLAGDHQIGASRDHLARSQRRLDRAARSIDRLHARRAELLANARHRQNNLVRHPDGGRRTVADLLSAEAAQRAQIEEETARGSRKHQRLPRWIGHIPKLVVVTDFCLLLYFFTGITDVNWASPLSPNMAFAVLLAIMVTSVSYGFFAFAGYRLRGYKDHSGAVAFGDLDGLTRTACAAAAVGIAVIAALMFIRMQAEVLIALGPAGWVTALVIALVVAVVSVLANFLVVAIHALDGSDQAARLEAMSAATGGPLSRVYQMQEKADLIPHRIAVHQRRAARAAVRAGTEAGRYPADADEVIEAVNAWAREAYDWPAGYRAASLAGLRPPRETLEHFDTALPDAPPDQPE